MAGDEVLARRDAEDAVGVTSTGITNGLALEFAGISALLGLVLILALMRTIVI
jgi:Na+/H+-translocating membrane pyrophosphatase